MFEYKEKEYTIGTFINAIESVGDTLSYIGTYYETPMLDDAIIATPTLGVDYDKGILSLDITLKPNVGEEVEQIGMLDKYVNALNMGFVNYRADPLLKREKNRHGTPLTKFLSQNSLTSEIQNYLVTIVMSDPVVHRMETVIGGVKYWKYTVAEHYDFGDGVTYHHKVHALFKEKTSDGENFFSAFVGTDINKRDTLKILDSLAEHNITGLFIGGYSSFSDVPMMKQTRTTLYGITGNVSIRKTDKAYYINLPGGGTLLPLEGINNGKVIRVGDGRYTLTVNTDGTATELYLG